MKTFLLGFTLVLVSLQSFAKEDIKSTESRACGKYEMLRYPGKVPTGCWVYWCNDIEEN